MPSLVGLGFHPLPGRPKTLSFLFVCLFVHHAIDNLLFTNKWYSNKIKYAMRKEKNNVRVCAPDFAMKALEYRNNFDAVG